MQDRGLKYLGTSSTPRHGSNMDFFLSSFSLSVPLSSILRLPFLFIGRGGGEKGHSSLRMQGCCESSSSSRFLADLKGSLSSSGLKFLGMMGYERACVPDYPGCKCRLHWESLFVLCLHFNELAVVDLSQRQDKAQCRRIENQWQYRQAAWPFCPCNNQLLWQACSCSCLYS